MANFWRRMSQVSFFASESLRELAAILLNPIFGVIGHTATCVNIGIFHVKHMPPCGVEQPIYFGSCLLFWLRCHAVLYLSSACRNKKLTNG